MLFTKERLISRFDGMPEFAVTQSGVPTLQEICTSGVIPANFADKEDYNEVSSVDDVGERVTDVFDALVANQRINDLEKAHISKQNRRKEELEKYK